jgi:hypothetical protein
MEMGTGRLGVRNRENVNFKRKDEDGGWKEDGEGISIK